eukprot:68072-Ditylum_brightwellii.AAC.1
MPPSWSLIKNVLSTRCNLSLTTHYVLSPKDIWGTLWSEASGYTMQPAFTWHQGQCHGLYTHSHREQEFTKFY